MGAMGIEIAVATDLGTGGPSEIAKSPRTGLPVVHLGRTITTEDVRLKDDDQ